MAFSLRFSLWRYWHFGPHSILHVCADLNVINAMRAPAARSIYGSKAFLRRPCWVRMWTVNSGTFFCGHGRGKHTHVMCTGTRIVTEWGERGTHEMFHAVCALGARAQSDLYHVYHAFRAFAWRRGTYAFVVHLVSATVCHA